MMLSQLKLQICINNLCLINCIISVKYIIIVWQNYSVKMYTLGLEKGLLIFWV